MAGDLPDIGVGLRGKKGPGVVSTVIGTVIGGAVSQGMTTRGEARRSEIRMTEASHAAKEAKGLKTHEVNEQIRLLGALREGEGHLREAHLGSGVSGKWVKENDNQNTGEATQSDVQKTTSVDPNTVSKPIEPGAQHGGSATGRVIPGEHLKDWGPVKGQLSMFDKSGRVSRGVAPKPSATPKTPTQGELF